MLIDVVSLSQFSCDKPIIARLKYATHENFVGTVIPGYNPDAHDFALMTPDAANALCQVQQYLLNHYNFSLLIYDSYRPKRAVDYFLIWSKQAGSSEIETVRKELHYPIINKNQLFELGYLAEDSNHCYGNTVDLVLIDAQGNKLDMGTRFDFMDIKSRSDATATEIGERAVHHRKILRDAMMHFDFEPYPEEYWHYTHGGIEGREVMTPMDVAITSDLKGVTRVKTSEGIK
ncbi:M15 family metallopeptidase [Legionella waltersii]|uniref:D-alanyl-D-alanine dipeptidase n=1 Tax=Legionella waltersii TaxID=66969 RepID=A0A0W0ZZY4_9GAMM|nr:M15 family metallopeptidase [Legionella waltersii]KTD74614.1 D-alanyl-D-alanine dipeptidase [Legionella waltersii]SNV08811.1 D-alanyl-D-alanine dipeptidase [Legionella waltersii]